MRKGLNRLLEVSKHEPAPTPALLFGQPWPAKGSIKPRERG